MDRKVLRLRISSAIIFAILFVGSILAHRISFLLFFIIIAYTAGREYARMKRRFDRKVFNRSTGIIAGVMAALPVVLYFLLIQYEYTLSLMQFLLLLANFFTILLIIDLYRKGNPFLFSLPYGIGAFIYPGIFLATPLIAVFDIGGNYEKYYLLVLIFSIWAVDIGAYFIGSQWGQNKLFPSISPQKTIEGALGGFVFAIFIGCLSAYFLSIPIHTGFLIGLTCGVLGIVGDLYESKLKRRAKLKDSSRLMPGHGGILDRFDGFIAALPTVSIVLWWALDLG